MEIKKKKNLFLKDFKLICLFIVINFKNVNIFYNFEDIILEKQKQKSKELVIHRQTDRQCVKFLFLLNDDLFPLKE